MIACPFDGYFMLFTNSSALDDYLPQLGDPKALSQDYINPGKWIGQAPNTAAGIFGSQITALALTLAFEKCTDDFSVGCDLLSDLYVCDVPEFYHPDSRNCFWYYNWTVGEIFAKAEVALSGVCNATINSCSAFSLNETSHFHHHHHDEHDEDEDCEDDDDNDERALPPMDPCTINNLNDCVTYINTAFVFGEFLWNRPAFSKQPCQ